MAGWTLMLQQIAKMQNLHLMDLAEVQSKENSVTFLYTEELFYHHQNVLWVKLHFISDGKINLVPPGRTSETQKTFYVVIVNEVKKV